MMNGVAGPDSEDYNPWADRKAAQPKSLSPPQSQSKLSDSYSNTLPVRKSVTPKNSYATSKGLWVLDLVPSILRLPRPLILPHSYVEAWESLGLGKACMSSAWGCYVYGQHAQLHVQLCSCRCICGGIMHTCVLCGLCICMFTVHVCLCVFARMGGHGVIGLQMQRGE